MLRDEGRAVGEAREGKTKKMGLNILCLVAYPRTCGEEQLRATSTFCIQHILTKASRQQKQTFKQLF